MPYKDKAKQKAAQLVSYTKRRARGMAMIQNAKNKNCMDCGKKFPLICMDFDHVKGEKVANLSKMVLHSPKKIAQEIAKCDVVCSNCHRIRTKERLLTKIVDARIGEQSGL